MLKYANEVGSVTAAVRPKGRDMPVMQREDIPTGFMPIAIQRVSVHFQPNALNHRGIGQRS